MYPAAFVTCYMDSVYGTPYGIYGIMDFRALPLGFFIVHGSVACDVLWTAQHGARVEAESLCETTRGLRRRGMATSQEALDVDEGWMS
jgi:hypothetical protein